jgi:hypothetical protein
MKWGIRRTPEQLGHDRPQKKSNAEAIKKADNLVKETKKQNRLLMKKYNQVSLYGTMVTNEASKIMNKIVADTNFAQRTLKDAKIDEKLMNQSKTPKRQQELMDKYIQQGLSPENAARQAYKRNKTEKILIGLGAAALVTAAAYTAYKIHDKRVDKIISSKTLLRNISDNGRVFTDI